jgi:hypothetical protein
VDIIHISNQVIHVFKFEIICIMSTWQKRTGSYEVDPGPIEKISPCCMGEESSSSVDETTSMILARNKVCTILRVAVTFSAFSLREDIATVPHMRIQLVLEKS